MNQKLAAILARTTRLPKGQWFSELPDEAQKAWQQIESELDRAGADYIEQDDQRGGAVLLVQEPRHLRGIALHVFAPSDVTHYERKLHRDVSVAPAKLTVWNQRGDNTELSLRQWKKAVSLVKKALGQKVEEPHGLTHLWRYAFSAADRRAVVVALIKANRRDLACIVAGKWSSLTVKNILEALRVKKVSRTVVDAIEKLAAGKGVTRQQLESVLKKFAGTQQAKDAARVADTFGLYEDMILGPDVNPMRLQVASREMLGAVPFESLKEVLDQGAAAVVAESWETKWIEKLKQFGGRHVSTHISNVGLEVNFTYPQGEIDEATGEPVNSLAFAKIAKRVRAKGTKRYFTDEGFRIVVPSPYAANKLVAVMPALIKKIAEFA